MLEIKLLNSIGKMSPTVHSLLLLVTLISATYSTSDQCYDHQKTDYKTQFSPVKCGLGCSVTPFFSPDHSLDTYMSLIESATDSIDIYTPGELNQLM